MCELLGMSANVPTDIVFSLAGLLERGGLKGPHSDGWGIGVYQGRGVRCFHDPSPGSQSELGKFMCQNYPIKSQAIIGHIRQANVGQVCLANTHPFQRELWGRYFLFAHNGQINGFRGRQNHYRSVGDTDSEALFCDLLNHLYELGDEQPDDLSILACLVSRSEYYRKLGVFNALISNGDWLFSYCSTKLTSITRRAPFGAAQLKDVDICVDFGPLTGDKDVVSIIATQALTCNEQWLDYRVGEWRLWRDGQVVQQGYA